MTVKIRLARAGRKGHPYYKIVVADSRAPRDGRFIEKVGTYSPLLRRDDTNRVILMKERIEYWLKCGASPTDRIVCFMKAANMELPTWLSSASKRPISKPSS